MLAAPYLQSWSGVRRSTMNERKINEALTVAGQPSAADLEKLQAAGYRTVVNLRGDHEAGSLADEKQLVEGLGLNYASIPTSPALLDDRAVERFVQVVDSEDSQPAVVHCGSG